MNFASQEFETCRNNFCLHAQKHFFTGGIFCVIYYKAVFWFEIPVFVRVFRVQKEFTFQTYRGKIYVRNYLQDCLQM